MSDEDLQSLYREHVLAHAKSPHGRGEPTSFDLSARGQNPLCGDSLTVFANESPTGELEFFFEGTGCAISVASASMMTELLKQGSRAEALHKIEVVIDMLHQSPSTAISDHLRDSPVAALSGVRTYPSRIKCAELAWRAAAAALSDGATITTETNG